MEGPGFIMEGPVSYINPWAWYRWAWPHPLLDKPWRPEGVPKVENKQLNEMLRGQIKRTSYDSGIKKAGIIVLGQSAAGKSSFINSLISCDKERISKKTTTRYSAETCTEKLLTVTGTDLNYKLYDTIGINISAGITKEQLKKIIVGGLTHGDSFLEKDKMSDYCNQEQGEGEKIQLAAIVLAADTIKDIPSDPKKKSEIRDKTKEYINILKNYDILPVYILTKVDVICAEVRKDPKMMFQSRAVKEVVDKVHDTFGPDENDIFPVINYVKELETTVVMDIPLLFALRHIVKLASDHEEVKE